MKRSLVLAAALCAALAGAVQAQTATRGEVTDRGIQPMLGSRNVGAPVGTDDACWRALAAEVIRTGTDGNARCVSTKAAPYTFAGAPLPPADPPPPPPPPVDPLAGLPGPITQGCPPSTLPNTTGTWVINGQTCPALKKVWPALQAVVSTDGTGTIRSNGHGVEFGVYQGDGADEQRPTGNFILRGVRLVGAGSGWGVWLKGDTPNVRIEANDISGFDIGIHDQGTGPRAAAGSTPANPGSSGHVIARNKIHRNVGMGLLGTAPGIQLVGNTFEANNASGSNRNHGVYLGSSRYTTVGARATDNVFKDNSVVNGQCTGGNLTVHGQWDDLVVARNRIEQTAPSGGGCWGISITPAYGSPEWFRRVLVEGNTIVNTGGHAIAISSARDAIVRGNRGINAGTLGLGIAPEAGDDPVAQVIAEGNCGMGDGTQAAPFGPGFVAAPGGTNARTCAP